MLDKISFKLIAEFSFKSPFALSKTEEICPICNDKLLKFSSAFDAISLLKTST